MKRREFLVTTAAAGISTLHGGRFLFDSATSWLPATATALRALPSADQVAWQDMEVGMFVHFAPNTWQDVESDNLSLPLAQMR